MTLLIHSMFEFADLIGDALDLADARAVCEIGAEFGGMSAMLAARSEQLISIDPAPKREFLDWVARTSNVRHIAQPSLAALADVGGIDAWMIDGDHNWYTVYHELKAVDAACRRDGKPLLAFLHDVGWPCARRDLYYAPDQIPAEFRHPHSFDDGVVLGDSGMMRGRGFRGMGQFALALQAGGPRNGVLTAVEDFCDDLRAAGRETAYAQVPGVFGLGILFDVDAPWAGALADLVMPFHENRLLQTLETNRLRNYLAVLDWQDRNAA